MAVKGIQLLQRFEHVTGARQRYLSEVQRREEVLGDILNRLGVDEEETSEQFLAQFQKLQDDVAAESARCTRATQRIAALQDENEDMKHEVRMLVDRRLLAEQQHQELLAILQDVYQTIKMDEGADAHLTENITTSFVQLERSSRNFQERRNSHLHTQRLSQLVEIDTDDDYTRPGTPESSAATPTGGTRCPHSPQPAQRYNLITSSVVPRDLSEPPSDEEPEIEDDRADNALSHAPLQVRSLDFSEPDHVDAPHARRRPPQRRPSTISTRTLTAASSSASLCSVQTLCAAPSAPLSPEKPVSSSRTKHSGEHREEPDINATVDETIEASTLEDGPQARPIQLKNLAPEHVEEHYRARQRRRTRLHDVVKHKCPGRKRTCDQCHTKMSRGGEHFRCQQCASHFCGACQRIGIAATCVPPPYWDTKAAKKRAPVPFGRNLENDIFEGLQYGRNRLLMPNLIFQCIKELDIRVPRLKDTAEGIFRKPGSESSVQRLFAAYADGGNPWLRDEDVDDVASTLKAYLKGLDEPLLTFQYYEQFIALGRQYQNEGFEAVQGPLETLVGQLPALHFFSLWYLMRLLHRFCKHAHNTKMGPSQYGVCFGPTLLRAQRPEQEALDIASGATAKVIEALILLPKRAWQRLHEEFLNRSQLALDISPVPTKKQNISLLLTLTTPSSLLVLNTDGSIADLRARTANPGNWSFVLDAHRPIFTFLASGVEPTGPTSNISARDCKAWPPELVNATQARVRFLCPSTLVPAAAFDITVSVQADQERDQFLFGLELNINATNASVVLSALEFPLLTMAAIRDEMLLSEDNIVMPYAGGTRNNMPGIASEAQSQMYPGYASFQFWARSGFKALKPHRFVILHVKEFVYTSAAHDSINITVRHHRPWIPFDAATPFLPYQTALRTFSGDWMTAATLYKAWAGQQWWTRTPLTRRTDIPSFLLNGTGVWISGINSQSGFNPNRWEHDGTWAGIDYLPPQPSADAWQNATQQLLAQSSNGPAFNHTTQMLAHQSMLVRNNDQTLAAVDAYNEPEGPQGWRGYSTRLCHGSREAQTVLGAIFHQVSALNVSLISFDQEIGGGARYPCYANNHGHALGWGPWMYHEFAQLVQEIKANATHQGIMTEQVSELTIPLMATYWSRQFAQQHYFFFRGYGEPIFNFLYHEFVTTIGAAEVQGQGEVAQYRSVVLRRAVIGDCVARGMLQGPFDSDVSLAPVPGSFSQNISMLFFNISATYSHYAEYVTLGQMVRPPISRNPVDLTTTLVWKRGNGSFVREAVNTSALRLGAFMAPEGTVGILIVNIDDVTHSVTLDITQTWKPPPNATVMIYDEQCRPMGTAKVEQSGSTVQLVVPGLRLRFLALSPPSCAQ
ncbi:uncharacterized protein MONBRDRAFT_26277 [Monosiga brevicollis MX1]|uniref:Rho-GAP domain-containing protein n=1 Tax=Monosiga brevicollis TaxID=81824 RepID=A9V1W6_MONBE|nr:uncharacterized protein MONBRDRAFT_26277 [Monosiga brevicollis MX1]EDQ88515.1 predicted protein [Monosiga brevicollis MX1]|eukprot:XP_001746619.1 hypothetical protein [Monosiga brevicollis MX1]